MEIGGNFYVRNNDNMCTANRNVYVKNKIEGTNQYQEVSVKNGETAKSFRDDTKKGEKEFGITNSVGRSLFAYIMNLDGNANSLTTNDFKKISDKDLQEKFKGKDIKVVKDEQTMNATISYTYYTTNGEKQKATLTIDFETEKEQSERESTEKTKQQEKQKADEIKRQKEAEIAKKRKDDNEWHNSGKYDDLISKFLKWLGY